MTGYPHETFKDINDGRTELSPGRSQAYLSGLEYMSIMSSRYLSSVYVVASAASFIELMTVIGSSGSASGNLSHLNLGPRNAYGCTETAYVKGVL